MENIIKSGTNILFRRQTSILSAAFILGIAIGLSSLLGIIRDRLLYARFYACCSPQLDAYLAAFRIPDMVYQLVVLGAVSSAFIPVFSSLLDRDKRAAFLTASSFINILSLVFLTLASLVFAFSPSLSRFITSAFSAKQLVLMGDLTRIMLIAQIFFLLSNFATAIIQTHQRFLLPALSPLIYNLSVITAIYFFSGHFGIFAPALGVVVGAFLHLLLQLPLLFKLGFRYTPIVNFALPGVKRITRLMLPRTLSLAVSQIEITVSLFLATSLSAGSLAIFNLAQNLMSLPVRLIGTTIGQATLPALARDFAQKELPEFKSILTNSLLELMYLALPSSAILLILRIPVVRIAFGTKTFPWQATLLTGRVLAFFFLAIFTQAAIQLLVRAFYATHDTRTPLFVGVSSMLTNIALAITLTFGFNWGVIGLAAANSVSSLLHALLLLICLDRKLGRFSRRDLFLPLLKMFIASFIMALFLWIPVKLLDKNIIDTTRTLNLLLLTFTASASGIIVYFYLSRLFRIPQLTAYILLLKKVGKWKDILTRTEEVIPSAN